MVTADGAQVLVCNGDSENMSIIDTKSMSVTRTLGTGPDPEDVGASRPMARRSMSPMKMIRW